MADKKDIVNVTREESIKMFDALSRTTSSRQIKPLDQDDYINYDHRYLYDENNLRIGDVYIMIPPEFIYVSSESYSQNVQTIRQENSQKQKTGYHKRTISIDLVFNGMDEINGYKVAGPLHKDGKDKTTNYYYIDGLRQLLAQFKYTPFLPVVNDLLNNGYNIYTVALRSITISTIEEYQNALKASISLQEVDMMPYIEMPNIMFRHTIDWDLYRYYIQTKLTENYVYKNLQSLPVNSDHSSFKLSILKEEVVASVKDTKDGTTKEESILDSIMDSANYDCIIDSADSDVHITSFECAYSNMLTSIQMSDASSPTLQYLGGLDTLFSIVFETNDVNVVGSIEECQTLNDLMVRNNPKVRGSIGFVKIESDFVRFCGSLFCTIESVETHTVPGLPGLYQVRLQCVSYDIAQSRREQLNGFFPFDGKESTVADLEKTGKELENITEDKREQLISQDYNGLMRKIYQDNYAENMLRENMEVYPDLKLPTYSELNEAIDRINIFRISKGLDPLPYTNYPLQPSNVSFGNKNITFKGDVNKEFDNSNEKAILNTKANSYNGYVDPDFYVFYPNTYESIWKQQQKKDKEISSSSGEEIDEYYNNSRTIAPTTKTKIEKNGAVYNNGNSDDDKITKFITILKGMIGHHYAANAEGEIKDFNGEMFDNTGLITYALKECGVLPENFKRLRNKDFKSLDIFKKVDKNDLQRGDIIASSSNDWFVTCLGLDHTGNISVIDVQETFGVLEEQLPFKIGTVYRILPLHNEEFSGTKQSNPYVYDNTGYPDEDKKIEAKKQSALETTKGYTSSNPYGDDQKRNLVTTSSSGGSSSSSVKINNTKGGGKNKYKTGSVATGAALKRAKQIWDFLKSKGLSDAGAAGVMGNWARESWNTFEPKIVEGNTRANAPIRNKGYGIAQWTWHTRQDQLVSWTKKNGMKPYTLKGQLNFFWHEMQTNPTYKAALKYLKGNDVYQACRHFQVQYEMSGDDCVVEIEMERRMPYANAYYKKFKGSKITTNIDSIEDDGGSGGSGGEESASNADLIKIKEYERRNRSNLAKDLAKETEDIKLTQANISKLTLPNVKDKDKESEGKVNITEYKTMTKDEFDSIAVTIASECEGESMACKMAMAQFIYDSSQKNFDGQGFSMLLKDNTFYKDKTEPDKEEVKSAKKAVKRVFCNGERWKLNSKIIAFTSFDNSNENVGNKSTKYEQLGNVNQHTFYGYKEDGYTIGYNVKDNGVSNSSNNDVTKEEEETIEVSDVTSDKFGKPISINPKYFDSHKHESKIGEEWQDLNNDENRFATSFVDDCQYSAKGRLVKAFPTFLLCILDDQSQWYDAKKLWTNYYVYKPVIDIQYHAANDMPTETAQITVTNTYHNLDRTSSALLNYTISEDKGYIGLSRKMYKKFGMLPGGLKITDRLIQMHSILFDHTKLREGARIHLRIGYGSDPLSLMPIINGTVSALSLGDQISITVTSDGHELIQSITSDKTKDINNGAIKTGLGATQEAGNIIADMMCKRESWVNHLFFGHIASNWYEGSKYNIEHFGLYLQSGVDVGVKEQYDLLMNVYNAAVEEKFRHWNYLYKAKFASRDGESNIVFNKYNLTPWDTLQLCAQTTPEFIVKVEKYQFDSRLYFGLPFDLTKYRYSINDDGVYQECKANTQMHYIDSITTIIENQLSVTSRYSFTNAKVMYTKDNTPKTTSVIHSDDTIDSSLQSTHIIDSCIVQDYVIDMFNLQGEKCARRIGISNLMYGWQQQYQGQILCLGAPQIKPDDYLMVNDFYTNLNGLAMVREVIHSFSSSTGFTTSIIPGIITFSPEQDTGNIELIMSFLNLYSHFTEIALDRKQIKDDSEKYAKMLSAIESSMNLAKVNSIRLRNSRIDALRAADLTVNAASFGATTNVAVNTSKVAFNTIRLIKNGESLGQGLKDAGGVLKSVYDYATLGKEGAKGVKVGKSVATTVRTIASMNKLAKGTKDLTAAANALKTGSAAGGPLVFAIVTIVLWAIGLLLDNLFTYLKNRNTVLLLPLWWEGKPFVSGIKGAEKILLIPDENAGSNENTGENGGDSGLDEDKTGVQSQ
jgi:hypothetical protein